MRCPNEESDCEEIRRPGEAERKQTITNVSRHSSCQSEHGPWQLRSMGNLVVGGGVRKPSSGALLDLSQPPQGVELVLPPETRSLKVDDKREVGLSFEFFPPQIGNKTKEKCGRRSQRAGFPYKGSVWAPVSQVSLRLTPRLSGSSSCMATKGSISAAGPGRSATPISFMIR